MNIWSGLPCAFQNAKQPFITVNSEWKIYFLYIFRIQNLHDLFLSFIVFQNGEFIEFSACPQKF